MEISIQCLHYFKKKKEKGKKEGIEETKRGKEGETQLF